MTCIATKPSNGAIKSKKELQLLLNTDPNNVIITDPSVFAPRSFRASEMQLGQKEICTNHPKRSWFVTITRVAAGAWLVK